MIRFDGTQAYDEDQGALKGTDMGKKDKVVVDHRQVMAAVTKSLGDGRMAAFRDDPTEENIDEIVKVVRKNLKKLAAGKPL